MILMSYIHAILMGAVEAITEFLPVSSTGHLILMGHVLGFDGPAGRVFEVAIQLGAILAVCVLYAKKIWQVVTGLPTNPAARHFAIVTIIAFIPAVIAGFLFHDAIKSLYDPVIVCAMLVIGGIAILLIEQYKPESTVHAIEAVPYRSALLVGFAQMLALIPGVSRSGATIMGALLCHIDRKTAAEFSFFQAIPLMLGAVAYDLYKNRDILTTDGVSLIAVGFLTAFIVALFVVRWMIGFVTRYGFAPFAWYRIVLGTAGLTVLFLI